MIVTPFCQLVYGDEVALNEWSAAHDRRHRVYQNELLGQGDAVTGYPLSGKVNADWFGRHILAHLALDRILPVTTASVAALEAWSDEKGFYSWHDLHNLLHRQIDDTLNLT